MLCRFLKCLLKQKETTCRRKKTFDLCFLFYFKNMFLKKENESGNFFTILSLHFKNLQYIKLQNSLTITLII